MGGKLPGDNGKRCARACWSFTDVGPGMLKTTDIEAVDRTRARLIVTQNRGVYSFAVA